MNLIDYLGKFHPLAVHLPIGILVIFILLGVFISRQQLEKSLPIIRLIVLISAISATFSSISGYILSSTGSYDSQSVANHQYLGMALTLVNWLVFMKLNFLLTCRVILFRSSLVIIFALLILTGHAGGSLTHGSDFLLAPPPGSWFSSTVGEKKEISLNSSAYAAASMIFHEKCVSCHGKNKQKADLRLDSRESILKGGEGGEIINETAMNSLLIEHILLPLDDDDHMPPKERKQLSRDEINFLIWWMENGANFENTLAELDFPDSLRSILTQEEITNSNPLIPDAEVKKADQGVIEKLIDQQVVVTPIGSNSNYLSANFVNVLPEDLDDAIHDLVTIKDQVVWLFLDYQQPDTAAWRMLGKLVNLRKLSVKNSNLNDVTILHLRALQHLGTLNLVGTDVSSIGLKSISDLNELKSIYLYQTEVPTSDFESVRAMFPGAHIDTGNYIVPILESDTTEFHKEEG